jgi:hypothetical protein
MNYNLINELISWTVDSKIEMFDADFVSISYNLNNLQTILTLASMEVVDKHKNIQFVFKNSFVKKTDFNGCFYQLEIVKNNDTLEFIFKDDGGGRTIVIAELMEVKLIDE